MTNSDSLLRLRAEIDFLKARSDEAGCMMVSHLLSMASLATLHQLEELQTETKRELLLS